MRAQISHFQLFHAVRMAVVTVLPDQHCLYLFSVAPAQFFLGHGVLVRRWLKKFSEELPDFVLLFVI